MPVLILLVSHYLSSSFVLSLIFTGFGGTNAHAIIEAYEGISAKSPIEKVETASLVPLVISANSEKTLRGALEELLEYLKSSPEVNIEDVAFTLQDHRSLFSFRRAIPGQTVASACAGLEKEIELFLKKDAAFVKSDEKKRKPHLLGIFTGQGKVFESLLTFYD